ncbi:hypothetical protein FGG78_16625 [Thioclava sp. BHET1]|nr:hypothetical protein FGG78_16625 [Thioclava sp. BHET1]
MKTIAPQAPFQPSDNADISIITMEPEDCDRTDRWQALPNRQPWDEALLSERLDRIRATGLAHELNEHTEGI